MNKRILCGIMAFIMVLSCAGVCLAAEEPAGSAATTGSATTTGETTQTTVVDPTTVTNLDPSKGDLIINGELLLNAEGGRAETLEEAVNLPEGFYESQLYLDYLNPKQEEKPVVSSFPDVPASHKHVIAIEDMKKNGYIVGFEDGTFRPENNVTRAEFVKVLIEKDGGIAGVPDGTLTGFTDVDTNPPHWAQKYISLGVTKGYLAGMGDGTFAPDASITYEQAMKILVCHFGKEVAAKTISSSTLPLWPNAYIVTGEQMEIHVGTDLSLGKIVNRGQFAQMLYNGIKTVKSNVVVVPSTGFGGSIGGGSGGGGGSSRDEDDDTERLIGVIVSTDGILIDRDATLPMITNPVYIMVRYTDKTTGEPAYIKLREPYDGSNREGKNMFKKYLGHEVSLKYTDEGEYLEIVAGSLKSTANNKEMTVAAEDIDRTYTIASAESGDLVFGYKNEKNLTKEIKLPDNLDDMAVVYNGVTIDEDHPSYDHDFAHDETFIKLEDILPPNGKVTFVNRYGGDVELAIVETYETVVPKASPNNGVVVDKYDETKRFNLDTARLLSELNTHYGDNRELVAGDIDVVIKNKSNAGSYSDAELHQIVAKRALTIYTSKDRTKVTVYITNQQVGGTAGAKVTTAFDEDDKAVKLEKVKYIVSDYLLDNLENNRYEGAESISDIFPLNETVVAYQDMFGEIVDVTIKEPDYIYGYLVDVDYEQGNTAESSYFEFRIITKENVSKHADPDAQTFKVKDAGKIKINDTEYRYNGFEEAAAILRQTARDINYGAAGTENSKPASVLVHATYAQPIRFVKGAASNEIKIIRTMVPTLAYTDSSVWTDYKIATANYIQDPANTSKKYLVGSNATIFSVPDDRFDYDKYEIKTRGNAITAYKRCNPEVYPEVSSNGSIVYNCVVLYDEGITGNATLESPISIVKDIDYHDTIDGENIYKLIVYQPSSITSATEKTLYVTEDEREADNGERIETGDVIVYGTTKIGTLPAVKNVRMVVDISDRSKLGFSKKYERDGDISTDGSPYYWYRYGTVIDFDADSDTMILDVGEDELMSLEGTGLFFNPTNSNTTSKPVYFYADGTNGDIAKGVTDRFAMHKLGEMVQPGDMLFLFASGSSCYQKAIYLIPAVDRDAIYPRSAGDISYADITFNVATEGATVTLAGRTAIVEDGTAVIEHVEEGVYTYKVTKANHEEVTGTLVVRNGVTEYTVNGADGNPIELERITCGVRFVVQPGNATVTIEGVDSRTGTAEDYEEATINFSGLDYDVEYTYTIEADGYEAVTDSFTVASGERNPEISIVLNVVFSEVTFTGLPEGATVTIDGTEQVAGVDGTVVFADVLYGTAYTIESLGYEDSVGVVNSGEIAVEMIPVIDGTDAIITTNIIGDYSPSDEDVVILDMMNNGNIYFNEDGALEPINLP